jgi:hypothetical protein
MAAKLRIGIAWVIRRKGDRTPIGLLEARKGRPGSGWATIEWLELAPRERGWGYGSEAVRIFEARSKRARLLAEVDPGFGLALYFWLRLGYRPALRDEIFWRAPDEGGIIAMIRLPDEKERTVG